MRFFWPLPFSVSFGVLHCGEKRIEIPNSRGDQRLGEVTLFVSALQCEVKEENKVMLEYYNHISRHISTPNGAVGK